MDLIYTKPNATFRHKPTLRVNDLVQFDDGPHAGICGELVYLSLDRNEVIVQTQAGEGLSGTPSEVSRVSHE